VNVIAVEWTSREVKLAVDRACEYGSRTVALAYREEKRIDWNVVNASMLTCSEASMCVQYVALTAKMKDDVEND
jgi:hypothetical protein